MKEKIYIKPELKQNKYKELIPSFEDLVFKDHGNLLSPGKDFETLEKQPKFGRPIFAGDRALELDANVKGKPAEIKSLPAMGKACFIEAGDGTFLQWKGIGRNKASEKMFRPEVFSKDDYGIKYPLGEKGPFPLFYVEAGGVKLLRFEGTAFYQDLLAETKMTNMANKLGIRTPEIIATIKFSRDFCRKNNLPIPANDDPISFEGQGLAEFIDQHKDKIDPDLYKRMLSSYEIKDPDYKSAILGQNIRKMKNVWRFDDIVRALEEKDPEKRIKKTEFIIATSKKILEKEFGQKFTEKQFLSKVAELLGKNMGIMLRERVIQGGSIDTHKQDITLAGEICDWDGAYLLSDNFLKAHPETFSDWVYKDNKGNPRDSAKVEELKKAWMEEKKVILVRQIFLIANHLKASLDAYKILNGKNFEDDIIKAYISGISANVKAEDLNSLKKYLKLHPEVSDSKQIAGDNKLKQKNLKGSQTFFNKILKLLT